MKTLSFILISAIAIFAGINVAYLIMPHEKQTPVETEMPGFLPICGPFEGMELEVSQSDWWPQVIRHIKHEYPGYCLASFQIINPDGKVVVLYTVKSPDGDKSIHSSMEVKEIKNI